jgi:O-antigen/teichoic acid export membrane protein
VQDTTTLVTLLTVYAAVSLGLLLVVAVRLPVRGQAARTGRWWVPMLAAVIAGAQLFAVELGAFLVGRANVWLAGWAFTDQDALLYSTASVLAMQVTVLEGLANIALTPVAARLWAEGRRDRVFALLRASATVSTLVTLALVAGVWLLAPEVLSIYGDGLDGAAVYLSVLATGGLGMSVFGSCAVLLVVTGKGRAAAAAVGVSVLIATPVAVLAALFGGPMQLALAGAAGTMLLFASYAVACHLALGRAPLPTLRIKQSLLVLAGRGPAEDDAPVEVPDAALAAAESPGVTAAGTIAGGAA